VARDHLDAERAPAVIALISVASTIGIGVGYPLAGLTEFGGVRAAYGLGLFVTIAALFAGATAIPAPPPGRAARIDVPGAALLTGGLVLVLLAVSETSLWSGRLGLAVTLTVAGLTLLAAWAAHEMRVPAPLVDVRLVRHRAVAGANAAMLTGGAGMYLLLTLLVRHAQTPRPAGYGFGLTTFEATMAILGYGVGGFSAAMPPVILAVTPPGETSAAMGVNQVVRSTGFALGSALGGLILSAGTPAGHLFPAGSAYTTAAWTGAALMAICAATVLLR
jgi:hypothetical protein